MVYYNQGDARWRDHLYGGADPMHTYGCGPTVTAMLVSSFSPQQTPMTPADMADWAAKHGHYAPQGGSYRSLIPDALSSYGLTIESVKDRSAANAAALLDSGHILIALMGPGTFTQKGHFIIITQTTEDGTVSLSLIHILKRILHRKHRHCSIMSPRPIDAVKDLFSRYKGSGLSLIHI